MTTETTMPWKATADVFAVKRSATILIERMQAYIDNLEFASADPRCEFMAMTRVTEAQAGPALVVTDVAEYEGGARQSAVVVSAVVYADDADGERLVVIRTHLEDQHTRHEGDVIVFEEHHDQIRRALANAVRDTDLDARHRQWPVPEGESMADGDPNVAEPEPEIHTPRVERARVRPQPVVEPAVASARVDVRQLAGIALLVVGFVALLVAIAVGTLAAIVVGIVVAAALGFAGNRIAGG